MARETIPGSLPAMGTLRLAWRNLFRNRRRTWITATTVAVAVLLVQLMSALLMGVEQQSYDNLISYQTGHAKVYAQDYFANRDELPLDYELKDLDALLARVEAIRGIEAATPRLTFQAHLSNGVDQVPCFGVGIQIVGSDSDVFRLPQAVTDGAFLSGDEGILLGNGLAQIFGVGVGDWLTVLTKTRTGAYEAMDLPIEGLLGTGNPLIDRNSFMVPLPIAQYMLDMDGAATEIAVRFAGRAREASTLRRLRGALEGGSQLEVKGWREVEDGFMAFVKAKRGGRTVMLMIFGILAVVGITNTVLMSAYERTREIGMLMAMGMRSRGILTLFLTEGALTGLIGGAIGTVLALAIVAALSGGIDIAAVYGDIDLGYPVKDRIYPALAPVGIPLGWVLSGVLAAMASWYPAARAARSAPVEALRHV